MQKDKLVQGGELVQKVRKGVVMFGSEESFNLLNNDSTDIFGDGTFRYVPKFYKQMYTLHVFKDNIYVPVAYLILLRPITLPPTSQLALHYPFDTHLILQKSPFFLNNSLS